MRYAWARFHRHQRDEAYRIYLTDALRMIGENTAKSVSIASGGEILGVYVNARFASLLGYGSEDGEEEDDITGDDIFEDFLNHMGLEVTD